MGIHHAGMASAADPKYTAVPQRQWLNERAGAGYPRKRRWLTRPFRASVLSGAGRRANRALLVVAALAGLVLFGLLGFL